VATAGVSDTTADRVVEALREVYDPCCEERGISIVDMGLVEAVQVADGAARVELVLTSGWCPFSVRMLSEAEHAIRRLPGLRAAQVEVVWDTPWDSSRMAPQARERMRLLPEPDQVDDPAAYRAHIAATRIPTAGPAHTQEASSS
jgi:metal-sulfur cluster biosynthetic enzyme